MGSLRQVGQEGAAGPEWRAESLLAALPLGWASRGTSRTSAERAWASVPGRPGWHPGSASRHGVTSSSESTCELCIPISRTGLICFTRTGLRASVGLFQEVAATRAWSPAPPLTPRGRAVGTACWPHSPYVPGNHRCSTLGHSGVHPSPLTQVPQWPPRAGRLQGPRACSPPST